MSAELIAIDHHVHNVVLDGGDEWTLGRSPDCEITVRGDQISRLHARIYRQDDQYFIEDLASRNHTYINKARDPSPLPPHQPRQLKDRDRITLCDVEAFEFRDGTSDSDSASSSVPYFGGEDPAHETSTISSKFGVQSITDSSRLIASPAVTLEAILEISRTLGRALSLDEVLPQVLDGLFRIFLQADRGFIALLNDNNDLVIRWWKTRREDMGDFRVSRAIAKQVMEHQEAILSIDAASDERFDMSQSVAEFRIRSMMCVPLLDYDEKPMGILQLDTIDQRKQFRDEDLGVLMAVATQASIAIDNARLHEAAMRHEEAQRELRLAREVQSSFLPSHRPECPQFNFFDFYQPANHVGGDFYDYIWLPDKRLAVIVADVVGHGVAAALLVAKLSAEIRYCVAAESDPGRAVTELNRRVVAIPSGQFITMVMAVLDPNSETIQVVNAGHMAPLRRTVDGTVEEVTNGETNYPLGILEDNNYEAIQSELKAGEVLFMFTDGLNEVTDQNEEMLGLEAVREAVARSPADARQVVEHAVQLAVAHAVRQDDDMCAVAVKRES